MKKTSVKEFYPHFQQNRRFYTDTRNTVEKAFFFAIKGENFDGNHYVSHAISNGAVGVISDDEKVAKKNNCFFVENTKKFLENLASYHRNKISTQIIALTGSNGKTTTKDLLYCLLSEKFVTHKTEGNKNNHLGVSFTLLSCPPEAEYLVLEMGANAPNDIKELCEIAKPNIGIVTNIARAHLEGLTSLEGVFNAKKKLYDFIMRTNGVIFVNSDDVFLTKYSTLPTSKTYGHSSSSNVFGEITHSTQTSLSISLSSKNFQKLPLHVSLFGEYNFFNILCAASVALYLGVGTEEIQKKLKQFKTNKLRSNVFLSAKKNSLVVDCYNANPTSMAESLNEFLKYQNGAQNIVLILGQMGELGEHSAEEHKKIVERIQKKKKRYPNTLCHREGV